MADNSYIRCKKCGVLYIDEGKGYCSTCGTPATSQREKSSSLFYSNITGKDFVSVVVLAVVLIGFSIFNIVTVVNGQREIAQIRADYEVAQELVDSGTYDAIMKEYYEMREMVASGNYYFTDEQMAAYYEAEAAFASLPSDIHGALQREKQHLNFIDTMSTVYIITSVIFVAAAVMMLIKLRISFKAAIAAYIISLVAMVVIEIWGITGGYIDFPAVRLGVQVAVKISMIKWLLRYNEMAYDDVGNSAWVSAPAAAGVPMPVAKDLNEIDVAVTPPDKEMAAVAPVSRGDVVMNNPMKLAPTEVAPSVQPVMPLTDVAELRSDVGVMTGEAVTPLDRPMIPVDMMEDEAMPAISLSQAEAPVYDPPVYKAPEPTAAPFIEEVPEAPVSAKGIWFCGKCGSLNENVLICNSCGGRKE